MTHTQRYKFIYNIIRYSGLLLIVIGSALFFFSFSKDMVQFEDGKIIGIMDFLESTNIVIKISFFLTFLYPFLFIPLFLLGNIFRIIRIKVIFFVFYILLIILSWISAILSASEGAYFVFSFAGRNNDLQMFGVFYAFFTLLIYNYFISERKERTDIYDKISNLNCVFGIVIFKYMLFVSYVFPIVDVTLLSGIKTMKTASLLIFIGGFIDYIPIRVREFLQKRENIKLEKIDRIKYRPKKTLFHLYILKGKVSNSIVLNLFKKGMFYRTKIVVDNKMKTKINKLLNKKKYIKKNFYKGKNFLIK